MVRKWIDEGQESEFTCYLEKIHRELTHDHVFHTSQAKNVVYEEPFVFQGQSFGIEDVKYWLVYKSE